MSVVQDDFFFSEKSFTVGKYNDVYCTKDKLIKPLSCEFFR